MINNKEDEDRKMIYTVFFIDDNHSPHDCETYEEAAEYGDEIGGEYVIESTSGDVE